MFFFSQTEMFAAAVGICSGKDEWPHGEPLTIHIQHINITEKLKRIVSRTNTSVEKKHTEVVIVAASAAKNSMPRNISYMRYVFHWSSFHERRTVK